MATEIKVPTLGESVSSATVSRWLKQAGERVTPIPRLNLLHFQQISSKLAPSPSARMR